MPPPIPIPLGRLGELRHTLRSVWLKLRGLTGEFREPEDSDRARAMTHAWESHWPEAVPVGYRLRETYPDRWIRFHSLPGSKRYADTPAEYGEILYRHRKLLAELLGGRMPDDLVVIAEDWGARDLGTGWTKRRLPGAWPWRRIELEEPELGFRYFWVRSGLTDSELVTLLRAAADDQAQIVLADPELTSLFWPYDGGVDIILPDSGTRDAFHDRHPDWLSAHPSGL